MSWKQAAESDEGKFCCVRGKITCSGYLRLNDARNLGILVRDDGITPVKFSGIEANDWLSLSKYSVVCKV
jgi:hypothetical protein